MKKPIDVEKLVQWAMRDELPKGQAVSASAWDIITQFCALGVRVQTSVPRDGYGFTPGAPHEDALVVAQAVRALATRWRFATTYDARAAFGDLLPIAGDAVAALAMSEFDPRSLVIAMAMQGRRPAWMFEQPTPHQMFVLFLDKAGATRERPLVHGDDAHGAVVAMAPNRGRAVERDGMYNFASAPRSPLDWRDPSVLQIGECRGEYVAWHAALVSLARDLAGRLREHDVQPPSAAALPWVSGPPPSPRVLRGADGHATCILPEKPKRPAPQRPRRRIADKGRSLREAEMPNPSA